MVSTVQTLAARCCGSKVRLKSETWPEIGEVGTSLPL